MIASRVSSQRTCCERNGDRPSRSFLRGIDLLRSNNAKLLTLSCLTIYNQGLFYQFDSSRKSDRAKVKCSVKKPDFIDP